jgi:class 3 adenylate cyclase
MTGAAPSGVVTFLFTDVEGSTRRWEADAEGMRAALLAGVQGHLLGRLFGGTKSTGQTVLSS